MTVAREVIARALARGQRFVQEAQLPTGAIPIVLHNVVPDGAPVLAPPSPSIFATMYAALALRVDDAPEARAVVARALAFIQPRAVPPGLWRYFAEGAPRRPADVPPDVDTTAGVLTLLRLEGAPVPRSRWMLEANHRRDGRFYTWFAPGNLRTRDPRYWWYMLRRPTRGRLFGFFKETSAYIRDIDLVVNIHVVGALGNVPSARGAIDWIVATVREGAEERSDKWYADGAACYLALGRAYADGVAPFGALASIVAQRVTERAGAAGGFGGREISAAMSASALLWFGQRDPVIERAVAFLCARQGEDGGWADEPHYWSGSSRRGWFGSRPYTTALVCEALALYRRALDA